MDLTTWVAGLLTAIIGGLIVFASDGKELNRTLKLALTVWVGFMALFGFVRILHDEIIAIYHVKVCQDMDKAFGLHFDDSDHKIDMKLHHFFMMIIVLLSVGVLTLVWNYDQIKSPAKTESQCSCYKSASVNEPNAPTQLKTTGSLPVSSGLVPIPKTDTPTSQETAE